MASHWGYALILIAAGMVGWVAVGGVRRMALRLQIGALPGGRRIHREFIPILGGLGIAAGLIAGILFSAPLLAISLGDLAPHGLFWGGLLVILLTGLIDDIRGVTPLQKFGGEFLAAALAAYGGCYIDGFYSPGGNMLNLGLFAMPFSILWIMFIINAVNLLDGLDGLAGGISLLTTAGFLLLAILAGQTFQTVVALALIGALIGFLKFNFHPAKIFMGDVGSLTLGYLLATFSIESLKVAGSHQVYFLASLVILGLPITDTLIAFFRRMGRGDHPFKPDREHIHHRLFRLTQSHVDTVWVMYFMTALYVVLAALMVVYRELAGIPLFILALVFSIFIAWRLGYIETRGPISFGTEQQETAANLRPLIHVGTLWHQISILLGDILAINLAGYGTWWFRFQSGMGNPLNFKALQDFFTEPVFLVITGIWLLIFWLNGLYRMHWDLSRFDQAMRVTRVITFGIVGLLVIVNLDLLFNTAAKAPFNRDQLLTLLFYWAGMVFAANGIRLLIIRLEKSLHIFEYDFKKTLLIGTSHGAKTLVRDIKKNPHLLYQIVGVVDRKPRQESFAGLPVLGDYGDLPDLIFQHQIKEILVAINERSREDLLNIIGVCDRLQVVVKTLPALQAIVSGQNPGLAGHALVRVFPEHLVQWQWLIKRLIDIAFSLAVLLISSVFVLPLMLLSRITFGRPTLVRLPILGRNGKRFNMYLLRLSARSAEVVKTPDEMIEGYQETALGRFLFRTQIYKILQMLNLLVGDMSLVGPRPEPLVWYQENQHRLRFLHRRLTVRPGVTGLAQLKYRFAGKVQSHQERVTADIYYVENLSLMLDLRIVLRSLFMLVKRG
ncbi:MAG: sugar transferase [Calditrichaeota bacterium]|nr:sugar transferase [Calditrichota bacterium]